MSVKMAKAKPKAPKPNWGAVRVERYEIAGLTKERQLEQHDFFCGAAAKACIRQTIDLTIMLL